MIHMTVINEGIHQWQELAFLPGIGIGGGLERFTLRLQQRVKTLLRKNDSPWLPLPQKFGLFEMMTEDFQVLKGHFGRRFTTAYGLVRPGARIAQIFGIGMPGNMPIEIPQLTHFFGKGV